jgi:hypothetical protein
LNPPAIWPSNSNNIIVNNNNNKNDCCGGLDDDTVSLAWSYVFAYLLHTGDLFLDGNHHHHHRSSFDDYAAKRDKLLFMSRQLGRSLGVDGMIQFWKNIVRQAVHRKMPSDQVQYIRMASQHTVLRLLLNKANKTVDGVIRFWREFFPELAAAGGGVDPIQWGIQFLNTPNPIPDELLTEDGQQFVDLSEVWSRKSAPIAAAGAAVGDEPMQDVAAAFDEAPPEEAAAQPEFLEIQSSSEEEEQESEAQSLVEEEMGLPGRRDGDETADEKSVAGLFESDVERERRNRMAPAALEAVREEDVEAPFSSSSSEEEDEEEEPLGEEQYGEYNELGEQQFAELGGSESSEVEVIDVDSSTEEEEEADEEPGDDSDMGEGGDQPVLERPAQLEAGYEPEGHTEEDVSEAHQTEEEEDAEDRRRIHASRIAASFRAAHPPQPLPVASARSFSDMDAADERSLHAEEEHVGAESSDTGIPAASSLLNFAKIVEQQSTEQPATTVEGAPARSSGRKSDRRVVLVEVPQIASYSPADDTAGSVAESTEARYLSEAGTVEGVSERQAVNRVPPVPAFRDGDDTSAAIAPEGEERYLSEAGTEAGAQADEDVHTEDVVNRVPSVGYAFQDDNATDATHAQSEAENYLSETLDQESQADRTESDIKMSAEYAKTPQEDRAGYDAEEEDNSEVPKKSPPPRPDVPPGYLADVEEKSTAPASEPTDQKRSASSIASADLRSSGSPVASEDRSVVLEGVAESDREVSLVVHPGDLSDRILTDDDTVQTDNASVSQKALVAAQAEHDAMDVEPTEGDALDAEMTEEGVIADASSEPSPSTPKRSPRRTPKKSSSPSSRSSSRHSASLQIGSPERSTRSHGPAENQELTPRARSRSSTPSRRRPGTETEEKEEPTAGPGSPESHTRSHGPAEDLELPPPTRRTSTSPRRSRVESGGGDLPVAGMGSPESHTRSHGPADESLELPPPKWQRSSVSPPRSRTESEAEGRTGSWSGFSRESHSLAWARGRP